MAPRVDEPRQIIEELVAAATLQLVNVERAEYPTILRGFLDTVQQHRHPLFALAFRRVVTLRAEVALYERAVARALAELAQEGPLMLRITEARRALLEARDNVERGRL